MGNGKIQENMGKSYVLFPKRCGHTDRVVLTVTVKARCSIEVVSEASSIFPINFRTKCLL
jgi:hypothetical protein